MKSKLDCPIETPGSTIVNALEMNLNSPQIELALVDSINEIVNALAAQLVNTVLQGGLKAVSGAGPSDSTAYIQEIQNEANQSSLGGAKDYFTSSFEAYFSDTVEYKSYKDRAVTTVSDVKGVYISASKCYEEKIIDSKMKLTPLQVSVANGKMAQINVAVINNVEPLLSQVRASQEDASAKYKVLTDLRAETSRAQSAAELKVPADRFTAMIGTNSLVNRKDVTDAQSELERVESRVSPMRQDAQKELQQCQSFPLGFTTAN